MVFGIQAWEEWVGEEVVLRSALEGGWREFKTKICGTLRSAEAGIRDECHDYIPHC